MSQFFFRIVNLSLCFMGLFFWSSCSDDSSNEVNRPPVFEDQSFLIPENSADGTVVGVLTANDPENDVLSFTIESGDTNNAFSLNATTGQLTVQSSSELDFEITPLFSLVVEVTDGVNISTADVEISLSDLNENSSPMINDQSLRIDENVVNGTVVGTIVAQDNEQSQLTFSIASGNTNDAFALEEASGELSVKTTAAIDFETTPSFTLGIEVSDGNLAASAMVTVNLNDIEPETFTTEAQIIDGLNSSYALWKSFIEYTYLFDAVYSNTINSPSSDWDDVFNHGIVSSNTKVKRLWDDAYRLIFILNNVISSADQVLNGDQRDQIQGQALLIRSHLYFMLAEWFENVPLETSITSTSKPLSTQKSDLLIQIIQDLTNAAATLPDDWTGDEIDNVNKSAANALLARVYNRNEQFTEAFNRSEALIASSEYPLNADGNTFEASDLEVIWGFDKTGDAPFTSVYTKGNHVPLVRSTESYLLSARFGLLSGPVETARNRINSLRTRNGDSELGAGATFNELDQALIDLWLSELDFEGNNFFTLRQFGLAESELSVDNFRLILPIPQSVIDLNENLSQNPGY